MQFNKIHADAVRSSLWLVNARIIFSQLQVSGVVVDEQHVYRVDFLVWRAGLVHLGDQEVADLLPLERALGLVQGIRSQYPALRIVLLYIKSAVQRRLERCSTHRRSQACIRDAFVIRSGGRRSAGSILQRVARRVGGLALLPARARRRVARAL